MRDKNVRREIEKDEPAILMVTLRLATSYPGPNPLSKWQTEKGLALLIILIGL